MTTYSINSNINSRISAIDTAMDVAIFRLQALLSGVAFYGSGTVTAGQSTNAAGGAPPAISVPPARKPSLDRSDTALMQKYKTTFKLPDAVTIGDTMPQNNWRLNWYDKQYSEWLLTEIKSKLDTGLDNIGIINALEAQIWGRRDSRLATARQDAMTRSNARWAIRNITEPLETISARAEEINTTFSRTIADGILDQSIKRAEMKDDNRKFSIQAGLRGEGINLDLQEGFAMRLLDAMEATSKMAVEFYRGLLHYYTDVTVKEYLIQLLHYSEEMGLDIDKKKADIKRYITNTRNIMSRNKMSVTEFDGDVDKFTADTFLDEAKAALAMMYNRLSLEELSGNRELLLKQIQANMDGFKQAMDTNKKFTEAMSKSYSQYVAAASQNINLLMNANTKYSENITA